MMNSFLELKRNCHVSSNIFSVSKSFKRSIGLILSQKKYTLNMQRQFGIHDCKRVQTPIETNIKFSVSDGNTIEDVKMY